MENSFRAINEGQLSGPRPGLNTVLGWAWLGRAMAGQGCEELEAWWHGGMGLGRDAQGWLCPHSSDITSPNGLNKMIFGAVNWMSRCLGFSATCTVPYAVTSTSNDSVPVYHTNKMWMACPHLCTLAKSVLINDLHNS